MALLATPHGVLHTVGMSNDTRITRLQAKLDTLAALLTTPPASWSRAKRWGQFKRYERLAIEEGRLMLLRRSERATVAS